jgi:hypothetical protein
VVERRQAVQETPRHGVELGNIFPEPNGRAWRSRSPRSSPVSVPYPSVKLRDQRVVLRGEIHLAAEALRRHGAHRDRQFILLDRDLPLSFPHGGYPGGTVGITRRTF